MGRKFAGEASPEELAQLEQLLLSNPDVSYVQEVLQDVWNNDGAPDRIFAESRYKQLVIALHEKGLDDGLFKIKDQLLPSHEETFELPKKQSKLKTIFISALSIAATVLLFVFLFNQEKTSKSEVLASNEISTKNGSKTSLVLPDGSKVWLNAGSKLVYDKSFGNTIREVKLSGEAFFDVVKNSDKPFIIHTEKMDIKVIGTAFNVKCYPGEKNSETSLIRGSIEVTMKDRKEKFILKPNEKLVIRNDVASLLDMNAVAKNNTEVAASKPFIAISHLTYQASDSSIIETSWLDNKLVFQNESFLDVAVKMERWYGVQITFANKSLEGIHLTGTFENENITQALNALQYITRFNYQMDKDRITISK
ncbi:MAG: FecR family protein [Ferruginibacter sp.]